MVHDSSFKKQLRKEITARAVMNIKIRLLQAEMDKNFEKLDVTPSGIKKIKKAIGMKRSKRREHRELSLKLNELNNSKTELKNKKRSVKTNNFAHRRRERSSQN